MLVRPFLLSASTSGELVQQEVVETDQKHRNREQDGLLDECAELCVEHDQCGYRTETDPATEFAQSDAGEQVRVSETRTSPGSTSAATSTASHWRTSHSESATVTATARIPMLRAVA